MNDDVILVWVFDAAPEEFRKLSPHGGDEDWLAVVPASMKGQWIPWLEDERTFGCAGISTHELEDGRTVHIGAHS